MAIFCEHGQSLAVGDTTYALSAVIPDWQNRAFVVVWGSSQNNSTTGSTFWTVRAELTGPSSLKIYVTAATAAPRTAFGFCVFWCTADEFYTEAFSGSMAGAALTGSASLAYTFGDASRRMVVGAVESLADSPASAVVATFEFASSTSILVTRGSSTNGVEFSGWAVYWRAETGVEIVTGERDLSGNIAAGVTTTHGSSVSTASRLALFQSFRHNVAGLEQCAIASYLPSGTSIWWERASSTSSYQSYARWFVVAFPTGGAAGQSARKTGILSTAFTFTHTISAVELARTGLCHASESCGGTGTAYPRHRWVHYLSSTTTVAAERWYNGQTAEAGHSVMDWSNWKFTRQPQRAGRGF